MVIKKLLLPSFLLALACRPPVDELNPPFIVVKFGDTALVVEGTTSPEDVLRFEQDTLRIHPLPTEDHYERLKVQGLHLEEFDF